MNRLLAAVMVILTATMPACSVPDEGSLEVLLQKIRAMDAGSSKAARLAEARQRAITDLTDRDPHDEVGRAECADGDGHSMSEPIRVEMILECLNATTQLTFALCVETRLADIASSYASGGMARPLTGDPCRFVPSKEFAVSEKWDPDQITEEDLARSAFASPSSPPAWMIAAGIVAIGAGGVFVFASGWGLVLCPLDLDYGCPDDPMNPGEEQAPGGSSSGGDR